VKQLTHCNYTRIFNLKKTRAASQSQREKADAPKRPHGTTWFVSTPGIARRIPTRVRNDVRPPLCEWEKPSIRQLRILGRGSW